MSDLYEARNSIYCYKDSNVLRNKLNITNNCLLEEAERKIVLAKLYDLRQNKKIGNFDTEHFIGIHRYLFEDIYPFAGLFRTENIAKGNFSFAEWEYIENELNVLLEKLKKQEYLKNSNKQEIAKWLAYYMAELNVLHPFREGNGRNWNNSSEISGFPLSVFRTVIPVRPARRAAPCCSSSSNR